MKELFDIILAKLNASTYIFKGNYVFRFFDDGMKIYELVSGTLVKEEKDINPIGIITAIPVVFTEDNSRVDWALQLGVLVRVEGQEYDDTVDLEYGFVDSVFTALNGTVEVSTNKFAFKVQPLDRQGMVFIGKSKYILVVVNMNVTQIGYGEFSQASTFTLTDGTTTINLRPLEAQLGATRRFYSADDKTMETNDYNLPSGRAFVGTFTVNYNPTNTLHYKLFLETRGKSNLGQQYTITETTSNGTLTYTVVVRNASEVYQNNKVRTLSLEFVEV